MRALAGPEVEVGLIVLDVHGEIHRIPTVQAPPSAHEVAAIGSRRLAESRSDSSPKGRG